MFGMSLAMGSKEVHTNPIIHNQFVGNPRKLHI